MKPSGFETGKSKEVRTSPSMWFRIEAIKQALISHLQVQNSSICEQIRVVPTEKMLELPEVLKISSN